MPRSVGSTNSTGWSSRRPTAFGSSSERLEHLGRDLRALGRVRLAAIGPATAEALAGYHLRADLVPDSYRSEALAAALAGWAVGGRILLARADRGRTVLSEELEHLADVTQVAVYHNADVASLPRVVADRIADGTVDWITLTSSAITARLHALLPDRPGNGSGARSGSPASARSPRRRAGRSAGTWPSRPRHTPGRAWSASLVERVAAERSGTPDRAARHRRLSWRPDVPAPSSGVARSSRTVSTPCQRKGGRQDEQDIHGDQAAEDPEGQVEQEDQADHAGNADRGVGDDLVDPHLVKLRGL